MFLFLTCRLKNNFCKKNLVFPCGHRARSWTAVGRGYASGKVLSLPSPGKVAQSQLTHAQPGAAYCSAGSQTPASPCRPWAPGAAPCLWSHLITFSLAVPVLVNLPLGRARAQAILVCSAGGTGWCGGKSINGSVSGFNAKKPPNK